MIKERNGKMSMRQIGSLRHRGEGEDTEVFVEGNGHKGWVRKSFLIAWLAERGKLVLV